MMCCCMVLCCTLMLDDDCYSILHDVLHVCCMCVDVLYVLISVACVLMMCYAYMLRFVEFFLSFSCIRKLLEAESFETSD